MPRNYFGAPHIFSIRFISSDTQFYLLYSLLHDSYSTVTTFAKFLGLSTSNPLSEET